MPPTSDPTDVLLKHNRWANALFSETCGKLAVEQFHLRFPIGPGSLHDSLVHILGAMRGWTDLLAGREFRARPEGTQFTAEELGVLLGAAADDLEAHARTHAMDQILTRERAGKTYTFTRGAVLVHVTTHGMHHRAQMLNMLKHLGVEGVSEKLPLSSVMEWTMVSEGA